MVTVSHMACGGFRVQHQLKSQPPDRFPQFKALCLAAAFKSYLLWAGFNY